MSTRKRDAQTPHTGKVANDHNKLGDQAPTQKNQGARSPQSRGDRDDQIGSMNQSRQRQGATGSGHR
ncbi:MAG: hypothetical protein RL522_2880 [Pseudomonadota bacterium]|jgi:hypothetical protein